MGTKFQQGSQPAASLGIVFGQESQFHEPSAPGKTMPDNHWVAGGVSAFRSALKRPHFLLEWRAPFVRQ
jgi:hypothetical protein